jgi:dTMP kinase
MSGTFLVVEGPDGAGKSTLVAALAARLRAAGVDPVLVREPGGTPAAEHIRDAILEAGGRFEPSTELLFIAAARAHVVESIIRPALAADRVVLSDRYALSTDAYQRAGRGLPAEVVRTVNACATGGLEPDLTVVLDVPPEVGQARQLAGGKPLDRLDQEDLAFRRHVADAYLAARGAGVRHLDGTLPVDVLVDLAWDAVTGTGVTPPGAARG